VTIVEMAQSLRSRKVSSTELTEQALDSATRHKNLNAFITMMDDSARLQARKMDAELAAGTDRGPLHGVPIALKDLFFTKAVRTTNGSKIFADFVPDHNAAVVEKLELAGAVTIGKLNMHEMAYGVTSNNPHFGAVHNPHGFDCIPGGSSGGSGAMVAAGVVPMAMGSDTGGSIRIPAAYCGTVGLKPTFGRVSRFGCFPLGLTLDHMGPLTSTVRDAAITLNAIAGFDARDEATSSRPVEDYVPGPNANLFNVRVGCPDNFFFDDIQPEVQRAVEAALNRARALGATIVAVRVPDIATLNTAARVILMSEASAVMERHMDRRGDFGSDVLALLDQGRLLAATDYVNAQRARRIFQQEFRDLFRQIDCLFTPTVPMGAPRIDQKTVMLNGKEQDVRLATTRTVRWVNALGLPALSLPVGKTDDGLPIGLQIVARAWEEKLLLRIGAALEKEGDYGN
jgi:aspartyl-tRNA(Asn)/glutamyl-tRNA(Gln) amidotransferase subunit A